MDRPVKMINKTLYLLLSFAVATVVAYDGYNPSICATSNSEGTLVPHEECNKFYECAGGRPVELECPDDTLYNPDAKRCDWKENVNCGNRTLATSRIGNYNDTGPELEICAAANSEGTLVPHEECNKFYECAGGRTVELECPDDTLYNPDVKQCDRKGNVNCGNRTLATFRVGNYNGTGPELEICAAANSEGTLVPHEECNKFYECAGGRPVELECPYDTLYNPDVKQCDWKGNVNCGNRTLATFRIGNYSGTGPELEICAAANSEGTLVPHEECNKFYECAGGRPVELECPGDTLYNPDVKRCDWKGNVNCGNRTLETSRIGNYNGTGPELEICAAANSEGTLVPHEECNKFYECAGGRPVELECPGDTLYNPDAKRCDWKGNVNCGNRTQLAIPVENSVLKYVYKILNENFKSAAEDCAASNSEGLLVPHEDCNKFYECAGSRPVELNCPEDTLYKPDIKRCDWPENVDCGGRAQFKILQ